ncbi:hypothetical protein [Kitasatospora sp. NPDC059571]|uniref:hypothetical protein n=1 Tax=Kitasatospora sp. NPDC059571 TaxID=3346871 RepID=UPI0036A74B71
MRARSADRVVPVTGPSPGRLVGADHVHDRGDPMRTTVRTVLVCTLLGASALAGCTAAAAAGNPAYPAPSKQDHLYAIPVAGITDIGDITKLGLLGNDFAGLLGS